MTEQESDGAMALSMQQFLSEKTSLNQIRLENETEIHQIEQLLRGKYYNWETQKWVETHEPQMNENAIREVMFLIRTHCNKIFYLSNFSDKVVRTMLHDFTVALLEILIKQENNINRSARTTIERSLTNFAWATILRAWENKERESMSTINKVVEQVVQREQQGKSFGIGLLNKQGG